MSEIKELSLLFVRDRHLVRAINHGYVDQLVKTVERLGVKAFPLAVTPDGVLFGGNHRYEAFTRLGVEKCWMHVYQPASIDREAIELNEATEESLPMNFTDHAELVWRKIKEGQTQQAVADELGWSRGQVGNFSLLQKIDPASWGVVVTTFLSAVTTGSDGAVTGIVTGVTFTENLLRDIVPLSPAQQLELVTGLANGKLQKGRFTKLAKDYRARNEMGEWAKQQLAGTEMVPRALAEIAKGFYDDEWIQANAPVKGGEKTGNGPSQIAFNDFNMSSPTKVDTKPSKPKCGAAGPKLQQLVQALRDEWELKNSVTLIHGDFYEKVQEVGDGSVDLILTDPPYNIARENVFKLMGRSDISQDFGDWDKHEHAAFIAVFDIWAKEFHRVLAENGSGYVFTSDRYISHLREALERAGLKLRATLVWHKTNPGTQVVKTNFKSAVEYILFFSKGESGHTFNWQGENEMHNFIETPICGGSERLVDAKKDTLHPTQKPLAVLNHLLAISSHPGDMVLDGFMGVGSTARAAKDMGRKFIGIEQDATFFDAAQRRMGDV